MKKKTSIDSIIGKLESKIKKKSVFGYQKPSDSKIREVGETWTETNAHTGHVTKWKQNKGFRTKSSEYSEAMMDAKKYLNEFKCSGNDCKTIHPKPFDHKMYKISGMCADCHFAFETKMRIEGTFVDFAAVKMKANIKAFILDAHADVDAMKAGLNSVSFVTVNGESETWGNIHEKNRR